MSGPATADELARLFDSLLDAYVAQGEVRSVLRAQLEGTLETSDRMAERLIAESQSTYDSAASLARFMDESTSKAERVFARVNHAIESADQVESLVLEERERKLHEAGESSRKTLREQRRIESLGEKAHGLGQRIRIVAMNTTIEATRSSGRTGTAIGVLAREIAGLAVEVQRLGLELKDAVHSMAFLLNRDLVEGVQAEVVAIADVRRNLAAQVRELRAAYEELELFRRGVWGEVGSATKHICDVASAMGAVQYQDVLRQRLAQVVRVLITLAERDEVLKRALRDNEPLPDDWRPVGLDEVARDYVMAAQRAAHAGAGGREDTALPEIELF